MLMSYSFKIILAFSKSLVSSTIAFLPSKGSSPDAILSNALIISDIFTSSVLFSSMLLSILSKVSRQSKSTVTTFSVTLTSPSLKLDNTSSILCVSSAIFENPIVAAIPLIV